MSMHLANPGPFTPAAPAGPKVAKVSLATYSNQDIEERLLIAARKQFGPGVPLLVGSYGYNQSQALIARKYNAKYFPIYTPTKKLLRGPNTPKNADPAFAGPLPKLLPLSRPLRVAHGREMGQRIRDQLRAHEHPKDPSRVAGWQLDEIWPSTGRRGTGSDRAHSAALLDYFTGVLDGLKHGRPGDRKMTGIVHISQPGQLFSSLSAMSKNGGLDRARAFYFLKALNDATGQIQLELYPHDVGSSVSDARKNGRARAFMNVGQVTFSLQQLSQDPAFAPYCAAVIQKLSLGLTPGHAATAMLGGNSGSLSRAEESAYREGYIEAGLQTLKAAGARHPGVSEFNWVRRRNAQRTKIVGPGNEAPAVIHDTFADIATARSREHVS